MKLQPGIVTFALDLAIAPMIYRASTTFPNPRQVINSIPLVQRKKHSNKFIFKPFQFI